MNDKFAVCIGKGGQRDQAESFARKTESIIADKPGKNLTVLFDSKGISLTGYGLTYQGDFENMLHRVTNGRLQHEKQQYRNQKQSSHNLKIITDNTS